MKNPLFVASESATEIARRLFQERLVSWVMGVFPERTSLDGIHDMLDIGCGPGGWGIDVARSFHNCTVMGVDCSKTMIEYARMLVKMHMLQNIRFEVMNTYDRLPLEAQCFDLINIPFGLCSVLPACRSPLLPECMRVLRPGGTIRLVDADYVGVTNSSAQMQFRRFCTYLMQQHNDGISPPGELGEKVSHMEALLQGAGCRTISVRAAPLDVSFGTMYYESYVQHLHILWTQIVPRLCAFATQDELDRLYYQMLDEIRHETFQGNSSLCILWSQT